MATIEDGIYSYLQTKTGITSIVSTRVYPIALPEKYVLPAIVYTRLSGNRERNVNAPAGKARPRFQFECCAETFSGALALSEALRKAVDGYSGLMGSITVQSVICAGDRDIYDSETDMYIRSIDFFIGHIEALA